MSLHGNRPEQFGSVWLKPPQHEHRVVGCCRPNRLRPAHGDAHPLPRMHGTRQGEAEQPVTREGEPHRVGGVAPDVLDFDDPKPAAYNLPRNGDRAR